MIDECSMLSGARWRRCCGVLCSAAPAVLHECGQRTEKTAQQRKGAPLSPLPPLGPLCRRVPAAHGGGDGRGAAAAELQGARAAGGATAGAGGWGEGPACSLSYWAQATLTIGVEVERTAEPTTKALTKPPSARPPGSRWVTSTSCSRCARPTRGRRTCGRAGWIWSGRCSECGSVHCKRPTAWLVLRASTCSGTSLSAERFLGGSGSSECPAACCRARPPALSHISVSAGRIPPAGLRPARSSGWRRSTTAPWPLRRQSGSSWTCGCTC